VVNRVRSFFPKMLATVKGDPHFRGTIVNTASMAGLLTAACMGIYSVSKHAVVTLSERFNYDFQLATIQFSAAELCSSYVRTSIGDSERSRPVRLANAEPPTTLQLALQSGCSAGRQSRWISAEQVAEITFQGIEDGRFYIPPNPETLGAIEPRFRHILEQTNPEIRFDLFPEPKKRRDRLLKLKTT
jgi:short-subunit dehydrogenase